MPESTGNPQTKGASSGRAPFAKTYCAIDLGAESGRVLLARFRRGTLEATEAGRFPNESVRYGRSLHWDAPRLWLEIRRGLASLPETKLDGIGVDAWGVDYALLGERGELLENPYHYRDDRTNGVMEELLERLPREDIYRATGIQFMPINTIYQLVAAKRDTPRTLDAAERLLTIPDLFHYWLSGRAICEFTNATTTQLVNARTRCWDTALIERAGLPARIFGSIAEPGIILGPLLPEVTDGRVSAPVVLPASHDTGSAVAAVAAREGTAFISSGTWSLVGMEVDAPVITAESLRLNFTNEGGVNGTTRLLKNVMGLWILQGCRKAWSARGQNYSYQELMDLAATESPFGSLLDPDDRSFLHPADMISAMDAFWVRTGQKSPARGGKCAAGAYTRAALESLVFKYRMVVRSLERLTGKPIQRIRVIGGGSQNRLLNQLTADATGKLVLAGPAEATALGNVAVQMLATGAVGSLAEARAAMERSFPVEAFEPRNTPAWDAQAERFQQYCEAENPAAAKSTAEKMDLKSTHA